MTTPGITRRNFIRQAAISTGMASVPSLAVAEQFYDHTALPPSNREVWIAGVSQMWIRTDTAESMTAIVMDKLKEAVAFRPDFICLPELFPFQNIEKN